MVAFRHHWDFAHEHNPFWERRLLCFADDGNGNPESEDDDLESAETGGAENIEQPELPDIADIRESVRQDSAEVRLLAERQQLIGTLIQSRSSIEAAIGSAAEGQEGTSVLTPAQREELGSFLEDEDDESDAEYARDRSQPERIAEAVLTNDAVRGRFEQMLEERLRSHEVIITLAAIQGRRAERLRELTEHIEDAIGMKLGPVHLAKLEEIENQIRTAKEEKQKIDRTYQMDVPRDQLSDFTEGMKAGLDVTDVTTWMQHEGMQPHMLQRYLGVEGQTVSPASRLREPDHQEEHAKWEARKALESIRDRNFNATEKDIDAAGNPTRTSLLRRARNLFGKAKERMKIVLSNRGELGTEQDIPLADYQSGTLEELDAQVLALHTHIDEHLQTQSKELVQYYEGNYKRVDKTKTGVSAEALNVEIVNRLTGLAGVQRQNEKRADGSDDPEIPNIAEVGTQDFLSDAKVAFKQMEVDLAVKQENDNIRNLDGDIVADRHFLNNLKENVEEQQKRTLNWVKRNLSRMQGLSEALRNDPTLATALQSVLNHNNGVVRRQEEEAIRDVSVENLLQALPTITDDLTNLMNGKPVDGGLTMDNLHSMLGPRQQHAIGTLLNHIEDPNAVAKLKKYADMYAALDAGEINTDTVQSALDEVTAHLTQHQILSENPICDTLGIRTKVWEKCSDLKKNLTRVIHSDRSARRDDELKNIVIEIDRMKEAGQELDKLDPSHAQTRIKFVTESQLENRFGQKWVESNKEKRKLLAAYSQDTHEVLVLENGDARDYQHEIGHAITDTFAWQTGMLPDIFADFEEELTEQVDVIGGEEGLRVDRETLLRQCMVLWGTERLREELEQRFLEQTKSESLAKSMADQRLLRMGMDEMAMQHLNYRDDLEEDAEAWKKYSPEERTLFAWLDKKSNLEKPAENEQIAKLKSRNAGQELLAGSTSAADDEDEEGGVMDEPEENEKDYSPPDINQMMREVERDIANARAFLDAYSEYKDQLGPVIADIENAYNTHIKRKYYQPTESDAERKALNQEVIDNITKLNNEFIGPMNAGIKQIDSDKFDLRKAPATGIGNIRVLLSGITLVSFNDIINTVKQGVEDVQRMWKRRGENAQAILGEAVTEWFPDTQIWGLQYLGRLKKEFNRRNKASEVEEVNQWKEALKDADSFELQDLLRSARNRDQIRAIFELLSERGRLDWNDEGLMRTLNALSRYEMPIDACMRSDILRDKWFHKIIADIWGDKDHYFNWRQSNDSNITSGLKKFTPVADQLSNVSGGLNGELERQLRLFVEARENGTPVPQDVNPHLYEEIIFYSIRNGKMTLEDKFYYIVQGIRYQFLSIDRLRTMAGEEGGILNLFPFIDYFYTKNNSLADLDRLGRYLEENSHNPEKRFKPGLNTTLFVRLEVTREQRVKERLKKGVGKQGENIDHDDLPYFLPEMDQSGIKEWLSTMSGNRQKLSKEALKNGYVGFSMKLKVFATLADMHARGITKFSEADARNIAQTIGAYVLADNILTRNGYDDFKQRPELSRYEFDQTTVMGTAGASVWDYRKKSLNPFVNDIIGTFIDQNDWDYISRKSKGDGEINQSNFFDLDPETNSPKQAEKVFFASTTFVERLEKAIMKDPNMLINMLRKYGDSFMNCGVVKGGNQFTMQEAGDAYRPRFQSQQRQAA